MVFDPQYMKNMPADKAESWWYLGRLTVLGALLKRYSIPPGPVLDIGAGAGPNLGLWKSLGPTTMVEPDPLLAAGLAADNPDSVVKCADWPMEEELLSSSKFSTVVMTDVLEHIQDERAALDAAGRALNPGGFLIVTVPSYQWLWSKHDIDVGHVRRYSRKKLSSVVRSQGFEVMYLSYFNFFLFPLAAAVRLLGKVAPFASAGRAEGLRPPRLLNSALRRTFELETRQLIRGTLPWGLSIVLIARKSRIQVG
jgi:SAM-dependent methyltransferase